jgi:hypothetical protein
MEAVLGEPCDIPSCLQLAMVVATHHLLEVAVERIRDRMVEFKAEDIHFGAVEAARIART